MDYIGHSYKKKSCAFKLTPRRRREPFIGASVGSPSLKLSISGMGPGIATSKSKDTTATCTSSASTKSAIPGT